MLLTGKLVGVKGRPGVEALDLDTALAGLSGDVSSVLAMWRALIRGWARHFRPPSPCLFLGRGIFNPVAMEGALKLKEISYIHAEAYPAGELKHGPLALVDADMPVVAVAPNDQLLEKLRSNLEEVKARGGELFVFADTEAGFESEEGTHVLSMPHCSPWSAPIVYSCGTAAARLPRRLSQRNRRGQAQEFG